MNLLDCPFCGKPVDLADGDTLHPSGVGWVFDEELNMRVYRPGKEVPMERRCYVLNCPVTSGGCGAEMHGDTQDDVVAKWNMRPQ